MKIEILFPEFCNLFGDMSNMRYLRKCLPEAEFLETPFSEAPRFLTESVNLVYLGPMTEGMQERVIEKFRPHKSRIESLIHSGAVFLFTGNALEVLGQYIANEDGSRIEGLGILPLYAKRDMLHRHNSTFLGSYGGQAVMGFKSQFTMAYPQEDCPGLFQVDKGVGLNKKCHFEGVQVNHFFGTYLIGPLLVLNPPFTLHLLRTMGVENPQLAFSQEMQAAYDKRLKDYREKT